LRTWWSARAFAGLLLHARRVVSDAALSALLKPGVANPSVTRLVE
jgi:hypothetical protein